MRRAATIIGWITLFVASVLILLGIASLPPGGLMFALPFVFLIPGIFLAFVGGLLVWAGRRQASAVSVKNDIE
jgi:protein-S-isoprenylcysteine O-methyltransferase Ste14